MNIFPIGYHVSLSRYDLSITTGGLFAEIGDRAEMLGESSPAVYLFADRETLDTAVETWFGSYFRGEQLSIFEVNYEGLRHSFISHNSEIMVDEDIPADRITLLDEKIIA